MNQPQKSVRNVTKNDFLKASWKCRKEKLEFYDFHFLLYHYKLDTDSNNDSDVDDNEDESDHNQLHSDLMSSASDFCPVGPRPALLFGLRELLVLGPDSNNTDDTLCNDTRAKMVVGAVNIALHNTETKLPCLVQVIGEYSVKY